MVGLRRAERLWLERYPSIKRLEESITGLRRMGSPATLEAYITGVRRFVQFLGLSDPETALDVLRKAGAGERVDKFIDYALGKWAHKTVRKFVYAVKKWLDLNDVRVEWKDIEMPTSTEVAEEDMAPSREDLMRLMDHCWTTRDRAVIEALSSSGLRVGTLLSLTIGDVDFNYPDVARIKVWKKRGRKFTTRKRSSQGRFYCTFITPEAKQKLTEYLKERELSGEKLMPQSPLITDVYNRGQSMRVESYEKVWARLLRRAGMAQKSNQWFIYHIHTLRKYFRSNCVGVDPSYREFWMGHKGGYLDESYFKAEETQHLAEYRKAIPHLSIYAPTMEEQQRRKQTLLDFAKLQGFSTEKLKRLEEVLARAKSVDEAINEFRKLGDRETEEDCQAKVVIGEEELIRHVERGWDVIKELNGGRFLLRHI